MKVDRGKLNNRKGGKLKILMGGGGNRRGGGSERYTERDVRKHHD